MLAAAFGLGAGVGPNFGVLQLMPGEQLRVQKAVAVTIAKANQVIFAQSGVETGALSFRGIKEELGSRGN